MAFDRTIPGQTPIDDISGLRDRTITTQAALNAAEAENIRRAVMKYLAARPSARVAPFDLRWTRRLHAEMFGNVWAWAGEFRTRELNIGSPPHQIATDMQTLLDDLAAWPGYAMPLVEQAVRLHHRAVKIHPFLNGNGRWSRMLANVWLKRNGHQPVVWPEETIGVESTIRAEYLAALRRADQDDYAALIGLHERFIA
jgi:Fic-DOC domain mobile mystery protein B